MTPMYVLPENVARQDGAGAGIALEATRGKPLLLTLGITRIIQQESLEVSIWGSVNKENWKLLQVFPRKFYCGTYSMLLDLTRHSEIRYIRAQWIVDCWAAEHEPLFGFYLSAEEAKMRAVGAA
jgi:hypothetical protein